MNITQSNKHIAESMRPSKRGLEDGILSVFPQFLSDLFPMTSRMNFHDKTTLESRDSSNENDDHADPWMGYILCNS